jgi:hypothetical protein
VPFLCAPTTATGHRISDLFKDYGSRRAWKPTNFNPQDASNGPRLRPLGEISLQHNSTWCLCHESKPEERTMPCNERGISSWLLSRLAQSTTRINSQYLQHSFHLTSQASFSYKHWVIALPLIRCPDLGPRYGPDCIGGDVPDNLWIRLAPIAYQAEIFCEHRRYHLQLHWATENKEDARGPPRVATAGREPKMGPSTAGRR